MLAFGLRHVYNSLKGSDTIVYQSMRAQHRSDCPPTGMIVDQLPSFWDDVYEALDSALT
jgi:hypothetical protein